MSDPSPAPFAPALLTTWLEQSNDLLALTDSSGGLAWANSRFVAATGLAPGPAANLLSLVPAERARAKGRDSVTQALRRGDLSDTDIELRSAGGGSLCVRARATTAAGRMLWTLQDDRYTQARGAGAAPGRVARHGAGVRPPRRLGAGNSIGRRSLGSPYLRLLGSRSARRHADLQGGAEYWTKPIDFKLFLAALERLFPVPAPATVP